MLTTKAPAKINWTLEVLGRRPDGYHEIASVMSTVSLYDDLTLEPADEWRLLVADAPEPLRSELESGDNLIKRAVVEVARAVRPDRHATFHRRRGSGKAVLPHSRGLWSPPGVAGPPAHILLTKRIPAAAGLGGGSSDAAAALRLISRYWKTPLAGLAWEEAAARLAEVGAALGSDVPFFVRGGTQFATGRGEKLRVLPDPARRWVVLVTPPITVERKTALLYGLLAPRHYTNGDRSESLACRLAGPDRGAIAENDIYNVFEGVAAAAFPGIDEYRERLAAAVGAPAHLCGAGPSLFALCSGADAARDAAARLRRDGLAAWAVRMTVSSEAATR